MHQFVAFMSLFISIQAVAKIIIVSDIDDTIRQSNVMNKPDAFTRLLGTPAAFEGLNILFKDQQEKSLRESNDFAVTYISASYPIFYNATTWIRQKGFPDGRSVQRQFGESKKDFKKSNIKRFLGRVHRPGDTVLFFGDNAELDPEIYQEVRKEMRLKDTDIFIRDVRILHSSYAAIKEAPTVEDKSIIYFGSELELLAHKRFLDTSKENEKALFLNFDEGLHIPDYMLKKISSSLNRFCKRIKENKSFCLGPHRLREYINATERAILADLIARRSRNNPLDIDLK